MIIIASLKDIICTGVIRCLNKVYASEFIGKLTGNADTATKATQDESGNNIKSSYASSISISDHTITLKNKNGASLGTVTVPDNNTVYTHPTTSGNKHIPSGGSSGQILRWSADGTAVWGADNNTTYGVATSSALGLVKSGTDITVDSSGNVSVNDDSHNHVISNVDGLQSALDGKASSSHTHSQYLTSHQDISGKLDNSANGADSLLSKITSSWTAIPTDDTYFIRQDNGGGNNFGRVKFSTLWSYIKGKADKVYAALTHTHTKSQITDFPTSMPASDVYSWAKASTKPTYTKAEVGLGNVDNTADSAKSVKYATSAGSASSASKATGVVDYRATTKTIQIGYSGNGISGDEIKYIAGYTTGNGSDINAKIKDVSKDALKSWLGLGSLAYSSATIPTIPSSLPANGGNSATVNGHTVNSDVPSGAKFTDTVYTHPTGDGNKHIPANGTTNNGKYLKATGTAGDYQWGNITKNDVINALGYTPGTSSAEPIVYTTGTAEKEGLTKLYTKTGTATDGTMTQAAIKTALDGKANILKYDFNNHGVYRCLGTATLKQAGDYLILHIYCGSGYNANIGQDKTIDVHIRTSNGSAVNGKYYTGYIESHLNGATNCNVYVVQNSSTSFTIWIGKLQYPGESFYEVQFPSSDSWASATNTSTTIPTNGVALIEKKIAYTDSNIATATALTTSAGSATQPIYFSNGKPVACTYSLGKSVPSNAVFTDTVYTLPTATASVKGGVTLTDSTTSNSTASSGVAATPYSVFSVQTQVNDLIDNIQQEDCLGTISASTTHTQTIPFYPSDYRQIIIYLYNSSSSGIVDQRILLKSVITDGLEVELFNYESSDNRAAAYLIFYPSENSIILGFYDSEFYVEVYGLITL